VTRRTPPLPRTERGEQTRRRLLQAAEDVFARRGYHDASIVKITEAAGVAQGTFYQYFSSKQQIFDELVDDLNGRVRQTMTDAAHDAPNRIEAERRGLLAFLAFTAAHPALYRIIRQAEIASPKALHRHYTNIARGYTKGLSEAMAGGEIADGDPEVFAWILMAIGEMVGMRWILWRRAKQIPPEVFEQTMAFIARGLGRAG